MTTDQALSPKLWPEPFQWSNFTDVFDKAPMLRYALNTLIYSVLATLGHAGLERPGRLRARAAALARAQRRVPARAGRDDAAAAGDDRAAVRDVGEAQPGRHAVAADHPELVRRRVLDLPAAPVLPDDPARSTSTPRASTAAASSGSCVSVVCRLAKPAIAAVALFMFLLTFNDFFGPLLYAGDERGALDAVGRPGAVPHAAPGAVEPDDGGDAPGAWCRSIVLFFLAQKAFVEGVTLTGVKE